MGCTISGEALAQWRREAQKGAIAADVPGEELDWLLREITGLERLALRQEQFRQTPDVALTIPFTQLQVLWQRRITERVPVQYLLERAPWRQFELRVTPAVLIPRPETELLIDLAIASASPALRQGHWADLGTGSGAIALGLATAFSQATVHAVDQSAEALAIAQDNAQRCGVLDQIRFYQGSWFEPLHNLRGQLSGLVSNPPYIPTALLDTLQPEVAKHEPQMALDGGEDGLDCIRHLVSVAPDYLRPGGLWMVEMMAGQAEAVATLLKEGSYEQISIYADLAGIERFAVAYRR
jgi:release factor glutamine methyltransferase